MASRTPRIAATLNNLALGSGTIITASSQETSLPVAFLRDPLPTRKWRSKLGWNVVAGYNDKLDFTEAAVARVATITAGNYATGAAYATAVQTAMNAAPGHVNTYTVTYDPSTKAFTITRSAGAAALGLPFQTGANEVLNKGAHRDLGFTDTDLSGVTQTGSAAYHSREWVRFDFGSAQSATVGIVHAHNMGTTGTANLYFKTADSQAWTAAAAFSVLSGDDLSGKRIAFFASQSYRYAVLELVDTGNTAGYSEFGVPFVGTYWQPGRGFQPGASRAAEPLSVVVRADQGAVYLQRKASPKDHRLTYSGLSRADRDTYQALEDDHRHVFFAKDPTNFPGADTIYGVIQPTSIGEWGPNGDLFAFEVVVFENQG